MSQSTPKNVVIVCSEQSSQLPKIYKNLNDGTLDIESATLFELENKVAQFSDATVVILWSQMTAELRLIIEFCHKMKRPLLVLIDSVKPIEFNTLPVSNSFSIMPYNDAISLSPWLELARQVRVNADREADQIVQLQGKLEERKWVEKAKGLLMKLHSIDESEAYRALRSTAMQNSQSMGIVAKKVVNTFEVVN